MAGLSPLQYELLTLIEQEYSLTGEFVSKDAAVASLSFTGRPFSHANYVAFLSNPTFLAALTNRGIRIPGAVGAFGESKALSHTITVDGPDGKPREVAVTAVVTAEQMSAVATIMDRHDTRSDKKKLQDLGIPTQKWQAWQRDAAFSSYYRSRAESLFGDMLIDAPRALQQNIARGDLGSIKLVYEMTGRWSDKKRDDLPIDFIIMKVLEVMQRYITNPSDLEAAASELSGFVSDPGMARTAPQPVAQPLKVLQGLPVTPTPFISGTEPHRLVGYSSAISDNNQRGEDWQRAQLIDAAVANTVTTVPAGTNAPRIIEDI